MPEMQKSKRKLHFKKYNNNITFLPKQINRNYIKNEMWISDYTFGIFFSTSKVRSQNFSTVFISNLSSGECAPLIVGP